jgi:SAM-dependent methyltransferase
MTEPPEADRRRMHEQNRRSWNAITPVHNSHKGDQAEFFRSGGSTLFEDELELLGDLDGKRLVHLQCNCGQDTLSLARLAGDVVGVDISDAAVEFATALSADTGIAARFVRTDLFDWFDHTPDRFDVAFSSYGTIGWLADLDRWAAGVRRVLSPGGRLVLLEFHPLAWSFRADGLTGDPYFIHAPIDEKNGVNDYVGAALAPSGFEPGVEKFENPERAHSFQYPVGEIITAIIHAGLSIESVREYPYSNGCELFEGMRRIEGQRYVMPAGMPTMPLMLGVTATRDPSE